MGVTTQLFSAHFKSTKSKPTHGTVIGRQKVWFGGRVCESMRHCCTGAICHQCDILSHLPRASLLHQSSLDKIVVNLETAWLQPWTNCLFRKPQNIYNTKHLLLLFLLFLKQRLMSGCTRKCGWARATLIMNFLNFSLDFSKLKRTVHSCLIPVLFYLGKMCGTKWTWMKH